MIAEKTLNQTLHIAKFSKKDEFYTQLSDIKLLFNQLKFFAKISRKNLQNIHASR